MLPRLFFGLVGLLTAVGGALGLNALFSYWRTASLLQSTPTLLFRHDPEIVQRLRQAGAQFGDPQFSLMWNNRNDLDLHVIDPTGAHIWYRNKQSPSGGTLDVDANANPLELTNRPVENIFWTPGAAPQGEYQVYVHHFANHGDPDPTEFTLRIVMNGRVREFSGNLNPKERSETLRVNPQVVAEWEPIGGRSFWWLALLAVAGWGAGIGLLLALFLSIPQRLFGVNLSPRKLLSGMVAGALMGFISGGVAQGMFALLAPLSEGFARAVGLALLGGLLGYGLAHFVPNLPVNPARWAGIIGGVLATFAFAWALTNATDTSGRLLVAGILGGAIGLMIALVKVARTVAIVRIGGRLEAPSAIYANRLETKR